MASFIRFLASPDRNLLPIALIGTSVVAATFLFAGRRSLHCYGEPLQKFSPPRAASTEQMLSQRWAYVHQRIGDDILNAVVVGGTSGIGAELVRRLALCGVNVVAVGQHIPSDALTAAEKPSLSVAPLQTRGRIEYVAADLSSVSECVRVTDVLCEGGQPIDLLVLSVGVLTDDQRRETVDHLEFEWQINYFSRFILLKTALTNIRQTRSKLERRRMRIINITSSGSNHAPLQLDDLQCTKRPFSALDQYIAANVAADLLTVHVADAYPDIDILTVDPGLVTDTALRTRYSLKQHEYGWWIENVLIRAFAQSKQRFVERILLPYCLSPQMNGQSGLFIRPDGWPIVTTNDVGADKTTTHLNVHAQRRTLYAANQLWTFSQKLFDEKVKQLPLISE